MNTNTEYTIGFFVGLLTAVVGAIIAFLIVAV
jgi:hypothetical protein